MSLRGFKHLLGEVTFALVTSLLAMVSSYLAIHFAIARPAGDPRHL